MGWSAFRFLEEGVMGGGEYLRSKVGWGEGRILPATRVLLEAVPLWVLGRWQTGLTRC